MTLLSLNNLCLELPGLELPILSSISYDIADKDFIIVLGSNGSGKSSLLKLIDGRYQASSGSITFKGPASHVKTLTQHATESLFPTLTLIENFMIFKHQAKTHLFAIANKKDREFFAEHIFPFNAKLSEKLDHVVDKLSGGEKQALVLALTVLYPPKILLLDEHTSALDPQSAERLMALTNEVIVKHQISCLLTTHDLSIAARYGNRILSLKNGMIHHTVEKHEKHRLDQQQILAACY